MISDGNFSKNIILDDQNSICMIGPRIVEILISKSLQKNGFPSTEKFDETALQLNTVLFW